MLSFNNAYEGLISVNDRLLKIEISSEEDLLSGSTQMFSLTLGDITYACTKDPQHEDHIYFYEQNRHTMEVIMHKQSLPLMDIDPHDEILMITYDTQLNPVNLDSSKRQMMFRIAKTIHSWHQQHLEKWQLVHVKHPQVQASKCSCILL